MGVIVGYNYLQWSYLSIYSAKSITCPTRCPNTYAAVCGSDGKTYSNKCQFNIAVGCWNDKIKIANTGACMGK